MVNRLEGDMSRPEPVHVLELVKSIREKAGWTGISRYRVTTDEGPKDLVLVSTPPKIIPVFTRRGQLDTSVRLVDTNPVSVDENGREVFVYNGIQIATGRLAHAQALPTYIHEGRFRALVENNSGKEYKGKDNIYHLDPDELAPQDVNTFLLNSSFMVPSDKEVTDMTRLVRGATDLIDRA